MHSDPDKVDATLAMPREGSVQISEILPGAAVFLINYTHTVYNREKERESSGAYLMQTIFLCQLRR